MKLSYDSSKRRERALMKWQEPEYKAKQMVTKKRGPDHPNWLGGKKYEPYCWKFNKEFKQRVRAFFNYQCVECGAPENGNILHTHHVNFRKGSCCDPSAPRLFVCLCNYCHGRTHGDRPYWEQHFTELIVSYYGGKCYFTKEEFVLLSPILIKESV